MMSPNHPMLPSSLVTRRIVVYALVIYFGDDSIEMGFVRIATLYVAQGALVSLLVVGSEGNARAHAFSPKGQQCKAERPFLFMTC